MVIFLSIILSILLTTVLWILLGAIRLTIETKTREFSLQLFGLITGRVESSARNTLLMIEAPFYSRSIDLTTTLFEKINKGMSKDKKIKKKRKKSTSGFITKRMRSRFWKILKTFEIEKCNINIDTFDYALNGKLYPLAWWISRKGYPININFAGRQDMTFILKNRLARIIMAAII